MLSDAWRISKMSATSKFEGLQNIFAVHLD